LLFVGAMDRAHNLAGVTWFLDHVWPRVGSCFVTGFVDDLAPWYRAATVFVSPLLVAGGLLQKVVDAMAFGVPVVATSVCNHGLGATPGEHLLTADTAEAFAAAVLSLLCDPETRARLGNAGQYFIQTHYDTAAAIAQWDAALAELQTTKVC